MPGENRRPSITELSSSLIFPQLGSKGWALTLDPENITIKNSASSNSGTDLVNIMYAFACSDSTNLDTKLDGSLTVHINYKSF